MNEKTVQQIAIMKEQTIGVEIEMNHITRDKVAKIAGKFNAVRFHHPTAFSIFITNPADQPQSCHFPRCHVQGHCQ